MDMIFSRRTVIAAIDLLGEKLSQADISAMLIAFGPEMFRVIRTP